MAGLLIGIADRTEEFLRFQGPKALAQENLDLFVATASHCHEEAAHNTSKKLPKLELEQKTNGFSQMLLSSSRLKVAEM